MAEHGHFQPCIDEQFEISKLIRLLCSSLLYKTLSRMVLFRVTATLYFIFLHCKSEMGFSQTFPLQINCFPTS